MYGVPRQVEHIQRSLLPVHSTGFPVLSCGRGGRRRGSGRANGGRSLEELRRAAEEEVERRRPDSGLTPLDVSGCTTRADYVAAMVRAKAFVLTEYEKMRFALSCAGDSGEHIIIEHKVC